MSIRVEPGQKRVRVLLGGVVVADTRRVTMVWEAPYFPTYYFPSADVRLDLLTATGETRHSPSRGEGAAFTVAAGDRTAAGAATRYPDSPIEELRDLVRFEWGAMDEWLEEDEAVYTHARDPHSRIDILASSRHVEIDIEGVRVADSTQPRLLFETGLPVRYYLPLTDARLELLRPSATTSHCPYKGQASYWSADINGTLVADVAWTYRYPLPESQKVAGLIAFYNERVDLTVDGVAQARPRTKFS